MGKSLSRSLTSIALAGAAFVCLGVSIAEAKTVTVWCWDPNFNGAVMKEAAARYAKAHPDFKLEVVDFGKKDLENKLQATLASGVTDSLPDIVLIEDYGAQKYLQAFPGSFEPLNGKIDYAKFAAYKVGLATVESKTYSVPFDSGVVGLFYRTDYLKAAGFSPADMENLTWDKYIEIGKTVEAKTGKKMVSLDPTDGAMIKIMMQSAGRWYFDKDGKIDILKNEALRAAIDTESKMLKAGISKPSTGWANWVATFTSGNVASVFAGVWLVPTIKSTPDQAGKWGVAPLPLLPVKGTVAASNLGGSSWYVLASAKQKAEAIDFLGETFGKDVDFYQTILKSAGAFGTFLDARKGGDYESPEAFFGNEKIWQKFSDYLAKVPAVNYGVFTSEGDAAATTQLVPVSQGKDIDKALKDIESQLSTQIQ
jgi:lactose/L-arabinose transport system substrate-binding protein